MTGFIPECLTISLSSECNLDCIYCYKKTGNNYNNSGKNFCDEDILLKAVNAATRVVVDNCRKYNRTFFFGFQGEGEPFMEFELLRKVFDQITNITTSNNLNNYSFITTNGVLCPEFYIWAAKHFNRICLSIDGPPDIHDFHRHFKDGQSTFHIIKKTLDILRKNGSSDIVCRTTITRYNVNQQESIVRYLVKNLKIKKIQFEPVYNFSQNDSLYPEPESFVTNFIKALKTAKNTGAELIYSGYIRKEFSLPYCNINKKVLFLTRTGTATACIFKENESINSIYTIGYYDEIKDKFILDKGKIQRFIKYIDVIRSLCPDCNINRFCVKGCPDTCIMNEQLNPKDTVKITDSLRCRINKLLYTNYHD